MTYKISLANIICKSQIICFTRVVKMSTVFTKKINPVTGKLEWVMQDENYDFHQEIARSAFADMLHDRERNRKYYEGIKLAVNKMHDANKKAHVLDIGTGTGLLSMMAAKCGADTVVACESFKPMAECAGKVIAENGFADKIRLVPKRSTELIVGESGDLEHRANILVTEVFDTELIGEGALGTFKHAHDHLLEEDCIVVPSSATVYAQVAESDLIVRWNRLLPFTNPKSGEVLLDTPPALDRCRGAASVHDIQLNQLPRSEFVALSDPVPVFRFDWTGQKPLEFHEAAVKTVQATQGGTAHGVFMWWDLEMDPEGQVSLSCAPRWARPDKKTPPPWRDHWMQAVYYLPGGLSVTAGEEFALAAYHDEYSLWFDVHEHASSYDASLEPPVCECCLHLACSRTHVGAMNDAGRRSRYVDALQEALGTAGCDAVLCLGETSLLGPLAARLGARAVYCVEEGGLARSVLNVFLAHNQLQDRVVIVPSIHSVQPQQLQQVTLILSEPHFGSALLPWQNLHFWYEKAALATHLPNSVGVMPRAATVWAVAVEFDHLWKICAPLHRVEGFSMSHFDTLIKSSRSISDSAVEPQPLWEYPCRALSKPFPVMEFNFLENLPKSTVDNSGDVFFESKGLCHGVALWADWDLDGNPKHVISTGPITPPDPGSFVAWDMHTRQGVYFFPRHHLVHCSAFLAFHVSFRPLEGDLNFGFQVFE
ncbi:protein arginine N-methyltransferase 7 isoform X2 [Bacillus rossius redtenbacheri]